MASKREPGTPEYVCICRASHVDALCASGLLVLVKCVVVGTPWSTTWSSVVLWMVLLGLLPQAHLVWCATEPKTCVMGPEESRELHTILICKRLCGLGDTAPSTDHTN